MGSFQSQEFYPQAPAAGITTGYDALGRPLTATDSGGGTTAYSYSNNDVLITSGPHPTGENAKAKQYEYDALGRLISVCEITAGTTAWPGGSCGQSTAATGYLTKYTYDLNNHLTGVTQNAQSTTNQTRAYTYDDLGRLTSEQNPETGPTSYVYDSDTTCTPGSAGDLVKKTDHATNVICYAHDGLHRVTNINYVSGPNASATPTKHFVYDSATVNSVAMTNGKSRLVEAYTCTACPTPITDLGFSYSVRGEISAVYEKTPHSVSYYSMTATYWANGALDQIGGIPSVPLLSYTPDGEGRPAMVTASSAQNPMLVTNTSYTPASQPMSMTFGTGDSDSFTYDNTTDRVTQFKATINTQSLTGTIGWNAVGTPASLSIVDAFNAADTQNCTFGHDDLVRIATVNCGTVWGQNFAYDAFGNVDKGVITGDAGTSFQANYSPSTNQISSLPGFTPTYDLDGNLKTDSAHTYTWNSEARPVTIDSVTLTYDALNRIVEQGNGSVFTETVYSPLGAKFGLMNGQTLVKAFAPLPDGAIAAYAQSGLAYYRHPDWLGSSRLASTPGRTIYSDVAYAPFGESYSQAGSTDLSFTGQNQDTVSGLFDFLYREYSPTQGRWVSPDPGGVSVPEVTDPQSWNRYAYVRNSPLFFVDSNGLDICLLRNGNLVEGIADWACIGEGGTVFPDVGGGPSSGGSGGGVGGGFGGGGGAGLSGPAPDPRCPGATQSSVTSAALNLLPPVQLAADTASATGHVVTIGVDFAGAFGFGTLALGLHGSVTLAVDPMRNIAFIGTVGAGGGFTAVPGGSTATGAQIGYLPSTTSVLQLENGSTITYSVGGGAGYGGSASVDLEGNVAVTVGAGEGVVTTSTIDLSKVAILACTE